MIEIIPAIDIINGECVRLTQGDYDQKTTYFKDPLEVAKIFEDIGIKRLHVVDLDGAKASKPLNLSILERITRETSLLVEYGGGIKSEESLKMVLDAGAERVICGSIAVTEPELLGSWLKRYGGDSIVLGADVKDGFVAINGWLESSKRTVNDLIEQFIPHGLKYVICTDIAKDGMLAGPSFELYGKLQNRFPDIDIIVSGGISSANDIEKLVEMKLRSVIVGKAYYEAKITLQQLKKFNDDEK